MNKAKQKRVNRHGESAHTDEALFPWRAILHGGLVAAITGALTLTALSLAAYFAPDPGSLTRPLGIVASGLSALSGGLFAMKKAGRAPLLCGLGVGILLSVVMLGFSFGFQSEAAGYTPTISALLHAGVFLCSIAGSLLGARKPTPKRHKKRQYQK